MKFLHAADLHLGADFKGIHQGAPEAASALRDATYASLDRIVRTAVEDRVDFVVIAGDIFNSGDAPLRPRLRFRQALARLHDEGIPTAFVCGNHDPFEDGIAALKLPPSCHCFPPYESDAWIVKKDGRDIAEVTGISYGRRDVQENLAQRFRRGRKSLFAVGLLHANCGSAEHANYAPCTLDDLRSGGFDYWALGHIHKPSVLRDHSPAVVYSGSAQGLHAGETGPRGCYLVEAGSDRVPSLRFVRTAPIEWQTVTLAADGWQTVDDAIAAISESSARLAADRGSGSLAIRYRITGRTSIHRSVRTADDRRALVDAVNQDWRAGPPFVWIEDVRFETHPDIDFERIAGSATIPGEVLRLAEAAPDDPVMAAEIARLLDDLYGRPEAARALGGRPTGETLRRLLRAAAELAVDRLHRGSAEDR